MQINTEKFCKRSKPNMVALFILVLFYSMLWNPPFLPSYEFKSYELLFLASVMFLLQGETLKIRDAILFLIVASLFLLGGFFGLFRSLYFDEAFSNLVAMGVNISVFLFMVPILRHEYTRRVLLITHMFVMSTYVFLILFMYASGTVFYYSTFGELGENKNHIGLGLAISSVIFMYYLAIWKNSAIPSHRMAIYKIFFGVMVVTSLLSISLIYARGAIVSVTIGILYISYLRQYLSEGPSLFRLMNFFLVLIFIAFVISLFISDIVKSAPDWFVLIDKMSDYDSGSGSIGDRQFLLEKGFWLITEDPIIGMGIGGSRHAFLNYPTGLIHNNYLSVYVDLGIFGFLGILYWLYCYIKFLFLRFSVYSDIDRVWILMIGVLFVGSLFKDTGTLSWFYLLIGSVIIARRKK
jgi:O-antigen ligase